MSKVFISTASNTASTGEMGISQDDMIVEEMARAMQRKARICSHNFAPEVVPVPTSTNKSAVEQLPHELLLYIFQTVVPPIYQLDPSIIHGPQSAWMYALRTRKALALTCKAFVGPATEVLYEDIVLRRMGQIPALARTLDPARTLSADGMAALVRSIRVDSCVVWAPFADVVREELRLILRRCTALRAFSFHPHINFSFRAEPDSDSFDAFNPAWFFSESPDSENASTSGLLHACLAHGLSALDLVIDLREEADFLAFHALLGSAPRLTKLTIKLVALCMHEPPALGSTRRLLALHDLFYDAPTYVIWFLPYICHAWDLPQLRALTIIDRDVVSVDGLLHAHGARLTYFHWRNEHYGVDYPRWCAALDGLGSSCPHLEHLVIPHFTTRVLPVLRSPALRFLDVWTFDHGGPGARDVLGIMSPISETPRLERVRVLVTPIMYFDLHPPTIDWPRLCHPLAVSGPAHALWQFPEMRVVQTSCGVFFEDIRIHSLLYHCPDALAVDTEAEFAGEEYEPGDEDGDVTSALSDEALDLEAREGTGGDEEDDEDLLAGELGVRGVQVDREAFLAMFHENQLDPPFLLEDGEGG